MQRAVMHPEYYEGPLQYGTTDRGYEEMDRAANLEAPEYINARKMQQRRDQQRSGVDRLQERYAGGPRMAPIQTQMGQENALRQAMAQGPAGAVRAQRALGQQAATMGGQATLNEAMGDQAAYGNALQGMAGQDIQQGLQGRELDQGWRQFQEKLRGGWRDQTRNEITDRRNLGLESADVTRKYNVGIDNLALEAQKDADEAKWAERGMITDGVKTSFELGSRFYGDD